MAFDMSRGEESGVYVLEGELDVTSVVRLDDLADHADEPLVLDLERLTFMDSSGLRAVLRLALARDDEHPVVLRRPSPPAMRLLQMTMPNGAPGLRVEDGG